MLNLKPLLLPTLFTVLTIIGAYITVPIGPVPFILSDFVVVLAGLVLGPKFASMSIGFYLLLGAIGLPVFAGGVGGLAHFASPTGGYLIGFLIASVIVGFISHSGNTKIWKDAVAAVSGYAIIYLLGVPWLKIQTDMTWTDAIMAGCITFLVPMLIKSTTAVIISQIVKRQKYM